MLSLVLAGYFTGGSVHSGRVYKGYFLIVTIQLPQLLEIDPRKDIMHNNATVSLAICFAVKLS